MPEDERRKKKKKKKSRRNRGDEAPDEELPLQVDQGEAEFAHVVADVDVEEQPVLTLVQDDDEDAIPAPIEEPDSNSGLVAETGFTEDGLAVAMAVDMGAEDDYIYSAIEYDPDSKPPLHKNRRFRVYSCMALTVVIAVVVIVVVYTTKSAKATDITDEYIMTNGVPTVTPTEAPTSDREASGIREQIEFGVMQRGVNFTDMGKDDPRYLALDWILHHDQFQLDSNEVSLYQRYILALMAYTLDSLAWKYCGDHRKITNVTENFVIEDCQVMNIATGQEESHNVWLSSTPECDWYGVICSSDDVVRGVELMGNDLIGEVPPEISELRFLQYLALNGNCLYGTIPPEMGNMPNLLSLELHGNGLSGEIPAELNDASKLQLINVALQMGYENECWMTNTTYVNTVYERGGVYSREFNFGLYGAILNSTGDRSVNQWASMKGLHLFDNSFYGPLSKDLGDLKYLVFLRAHNNLLSGLIPEEVTNLKKLRELNLQKNALFYDIPPSIGNMEDLEDLRLAENEMTGPIPESLYDLKKMKKLFLQDTLLCNADGQKCVVSPLAGFSGSISTKIGNLKKLTLLLLNNNPLTGTIPTEIGLCENLAVVHIHKTNIEGSAPDELCELRDKELNNDLNSGVFYSDCRPNNKTQDPFFACECCSDCCDHTTQVCIADD